MANQVDGKSINQLASNLNLEERKRFLEKLKTKSHMSSESLYNEADDIGEKAQQSEARYKKLPWNSRLYYFLVARVKGTSTIKVYEEKLYTKLGRKIHSTSSRLFNYKKKLLLTGFYDLTVKLRDAARFFYTALDSGVNRDKGSFYVFMGSLEMEDVHEKLQTGLKAVFDTNPNVRESELRSMVARVMEDSFNRITDAQREKMYNNARSLNSLKELSSFSFDRLLLSFVSSRGGKTCSVALIRETLSNLNQILYSLKEPPSLPLLESLFLFKLQNKMENRSFDSDREIQELLVSAEEAVEAIRQFNKKVPLTLILRFANRDLTYVPQRISGGEDWFSTYRDHWKQQIESVVTEFIQQRMSFEMSKSFQYLFNGADLIALDNAASETNPDGFPLPEAYTLAFLRTFFTLVFLPDINTTVQPILLEGEFLNQENKTEFTKSYSDFLRIGEDIARIDNKIASYGEYGTRYGQVIIDRASAPVRMKKIKIITEEASQEAKNLITRSITAAGSIINVLTGIIKKDTGNEYKSISNLEKLSGNRPETFINDIQKSIERIQMVLQILKDMEVLVTGDSTR